MKFMLIIVFLGQLLLAAPAFQGKRTFTQPNGEVITYRLQGDQYLHWMEKDNGEVILYSEENRQMESAVIQDGQLKSSGHVVSNRQHTRQASAQQKKISHKDLETIYRLQREKYNKHQKKSPTHRAHPH